MTEQQPSTRSDIERLADAVEQLATAARAMVEAAAPAIAAMTAELHRAADRRPRRSPYVPEFGYRTDPPAWLRRATDPNQT